MSRRKKRKPRPPANIRITMAERGLNDWKDYLSNIRADHRVFLPDPWQTLSDGLAVGAAKPVGPAAVTKTFADTLNEWKEKAHRLWGDYFVSFDC